jgi:hypothetical protein
VLNHRGTGILPELDISASRILQFCLPEARRSNFMLTNDPDSAYSPTLEAFQSGALLAGRGLTYPGRWVPVTRRKAARKNAYDDL